MFKRAPRPDKPPMAWPGRQQFSKQARSEGVAQPKTVAKRNPRLLSMARDQACLLHVPGVCNGNRQTVVAAHSNWAKHGKAKGRKADDQYHVYACSACHAWLDQGSAPAYEKKAYFIAAHVWMVGIWRDIASGFQGATPKDKAAAQWALDQLNATPLGDIDGTR